MVVDGENSARIRLGILLTPLKRSDNTRFVFQGKVQTMILAYLFSVLGARFFSLPLVLLFRSSGDAAISSIPHVYCPARGSVVFTLRDVLHGIGLNAACGGKPIFCRLIS